MSEMQPPTSRQIAELQGEISGLAWRLARVEAYLQGAPIVNTPSAPAAPPSATPPLPRVPTPNVAVPNAAPKVSPPNAAPPNVVPNAATARGPMTPDAQRAALQGIAGAAGATTSAARSAASPASAPRKTSPPKARVDWESLIGGRWALWLGSLCLFLALASFLAYTWNSLPPAPPWARVAMGLAGGGALLGMGAFSRKRAQRWFSEGLSGAGLGALYLSLWAGAGYFHILPWSAAFACMAGTTALGVMLALRYDAPSLSTLATLGGFLTPLLLQRAGANASGAHGVGLLLYVSVLNAGVLSVALFKRWRGLSWLAFVSTWLLLGGWSLHTYSPQLRPETFALVSLNFGLFLGASCFNSLRRGEATAPQELLLFFANAFVYAVAGELLLRGALALPGSFALALALMFGFISASVRALAPKNETLRQSAVGLGLFFLTIAIPMQLGQKWLSIGWSVEAGVLLILSRRLRAPLLCHGGQIVWGLSLLSLCASLSSLPSSAPIVFNARALPLLASVLVAWLLTLAPRGDFKDELQPYYASFATFAGAGLIGLELYEACRRHPMPTSGTWHAGALFIIAALSSVYALGVWEIGTRRRDLALRWSALALALLCAVLPTWTTLSFSTQGWAPLWNLRVMAYLVVTGALGVLAWRVMREPSPTEAQAREMEALNLVPAIVSLCALAGATLELWFGFARNGACGVGFECGWRASAGFAIALLWSVFAVVIVALGDKWKQPQLRSLGAWIGVLSVALLLLDAASSIANARTPLFNSRALAFVVCASCALWTARRQLKASANASANGSANASTATAWPLALAAAALLLWGATQETFEAARYFRGSLGAHWELVAAFAIAVLWSGAAGALLWTGLAKRERVLRVAALLVGGVAVVGLLLISLGATQLGWAPLFNARLGAFVWSAGVLAFGAWKLRAKRDELPDDERATVIPLGVFASALLLWGLTIEVGDAAFYWRQAFGPEWERVAQMAVSLLWSLYGALLLIGGVARRLRAARLSGLGLLGLTALKVFVFDLSFLNGASRIFSLAGLGLALIFISWLYGRFGAGRALNE